MCSVRILSLLFVGTLGFHIEREYASLSLSEIIDQVNNGVNTWKAGHNFAADTPDFYFKSLTGTLPMDDTNPELQEFLEQSKEISKEYKNEEEEEEEEDDDSRGDDVETMGCRNAKGLPRNFDARQKWPFCPSLNHILDQSSCGSCWAVSVASAISDRLCIASNGYFKGQVSAQQITSCTKGSYGCNGGWPQLAWKYWGHNGVVTGGDYQSKEGCQPYLLPPCDHRQDGPHTNCSALGILKTPECKQECFNPEFESTYKFDLKKGKKARMVSRCNAMRQIYEHGPLVAIYTVYKDFFLYKSGVYQHVTGDKAGLHAVRVLGWGIEDDTPYWLVANSWNSNWGDNGVFKILRGENEADFEMGFNVGFPEFLKL